MNRYNTNDNKGKKKKAVILLLIALAIIVAVFLLLRSCEGGLMAIEPQATAVYLEDDGSSIEGEAEQKEREEIMEELERQQLVVTDKLSSNITFSSGAVGTVGEWIVENPEENSIIQQAEVYLGDVLIGKSTPIYPNQHITGLELLSPIDTGEYEVTAYLYYYDIDTKEFISKAGYKIHLTVR